MTSVPATISFHLCNRDATAQLGSVLGDALRMTRTQVERVHPDAGALFVLLSGELGAGKTSIARGIAAGLGADEDAVSSPTFTIRMDHAGETRAFVHIDAWRITEDDLDQIGFDELVTSDAVVALEWPERIANRLPKRHIRIALEYAAPLEQDDRGAGEPTRTATISCHGFEPREAERIHEALMLLVRAPRLREPHCPTCGKLLPAHESGGVSPFCSPRCQRADLGDWLLMRHRIAGSETPEFDES